jgi:hypothetical protein
MDLPNDQPPDNLDAIEMTQNYTGINEAMMNSYEFDRSPHGANGYSLEELATRIQLLQQQCDANQTLLNNLHKIS